MDEDLKRAINDFFSFEEKEFYENENGVNINSMIYQFNENNDDLFYDKVAISHVLNGNGVQQVSTAPIATGVSQKLSDLNQGKNIFSKTGVGL